MMAAALVSVTLLAVAFFAAGFACGSAHGKHAARVQAFNQCIDWAALAMRGSPTWRFLSADAALLKAATLIGGVDVLVPPPPASRVRPQIAIPPVLSKGNQA